MLLKIQKRLKTPNGESAQDLTHSLTFLSNTFQIHFLSFSIYYAIKCICVNITAHTTKQHQNS